MASSVGISFYPEKGKATNAIQEFRSGPINKPRKIRVINITNKYIAEWNDSLNDDEALVWDATGVLGALVTTGGFKLISGDSSQPGGWQLGVLANINDTTTEDFYIEVWG